MDKNTLLNVKNLKKNFYNNEGLFGGSKNVVKAVNDVNFQINDGEVFGLVGESGCGKTTTARCILRAIEPTSGQLLFQKEDGQIVDIAKLNGRELKKFRKEMQLIFQDPYSSLNPRMTVKRIIGEPLLVNNIAKGQEMEDMVIDLMEKVGLPPEYLNRYPHAFSGGQRQRIGIARALILNPGFVVCDEPVSALDMSVQAQILNLFQDLQEDLSLTWLFIAHDLGVVKHVSNRIGVMYVGKLVEVTGAEELYRKPLHPYTEALLSSVPKPEPKLKTNRIKLEGQVADASNPPDGCFFHPRCRYAKSVCSQEIPELNEVDKKGKEHLVACHRAQELDLRGIKKVN